MKVGTTVCEYVYDKDTIIRELDEVGHAFLPTIRPVIDANDIYGKFLAENISNTYAEATTTHQMLIELLNLRPLFSALHALAEQKVKKSVNPKDEYLIARHVKPGQVSEGYRGHFDSHFITIVLPIKIPKNIQPKKSGQLVALPQARKIPNFELKNIYQKIVWKRYNSPSHYDRLVSEKNALELDFSDYRPLIFIGNTTFHGNRPLIGEDEPRLSMLCHLYDTSPKVGIGALLRKLRNR